MTSFKAALLGPLSLALLLSGIATTAAGYPVASIPAAQQNVDTDLLLDVRLDQHVLSEAITAYQSDGHIFLPLGELSRLLTIAIRTEPELGRAGGYIVREGRTFGLDVSGSTVVVNGLTEAFDPALLRVLPDDIYVASGLLERWLPINLKTDLSSLSLQVHPREKLPLQARLEREKLGIRTASRSHRSTPDYPYQATPYRLADTPFIDQTIGLDLRSTGTGTVAEAAYATYLTADLLGMESALFFSGRTQRPSEARLTLGRRDPRAELLGPLHARTALIGSIAVPGVPNIVQGNPAGTGLMLSNRPLASPSSFDRHTLQGDLPPGWDVELHFNNALIGFQQSRPDGKYSFTDLPLMYGPNEFRLVFHGPLGQTRVDRQTFLLEQSIIEAGNFYYTLADHHDEDGLRRSIAQFDWGLSHRLTATGGVVRLPVAEVEQGYTNLGLRAFRKAVIFTGDLVRADNGGTLAEAALKTRLAGLSISASHAWAKRFTSDLFLPTDDPVSRREQVRVDGIIPLGLMSQTPIALEVRRDTLASGAENTQISGRVSVYRGNSSASNVLRWNENRGSRFADGALYLRSRAAGIGVSAELQYGMLPHARLAGVALSGDKDLPGAYRLNLNLNHTLEDRTTLYAAGLNKTLGRFGLGTNVSYSSNGDFAIGIRLFIGMGRKPRQSAWFTDAQPTAGSGAASVRVFLDDNQNGVMDEGEAPIQNVGFTVDGGIQPVRTDAAGFAYLRRLSPYREVDIELDSATLEDPQWVPRQKGLRLVPRPGRVGELDFPIVMTGEIDGTTYLLEQGKRRPIGNLQLELLDANGKLVAATSSAVDGFYVVPSVFPGKYLLRVSPEQLKRLNLAHNDMHSVTVESNGSMVNGFDIVLEPGNS